MPNPRIKTDYRQPAWVLTEVPTTCARCYGYLRLIIPPRGVPYWKCDRCDHESDACYILAEIDALSSTNHVEVKS